ncbi:unnamed protein product [Closterium sp. Yama58-4]|nr:unnamed protein product [Closterium sp. Yama58-4]
MISAPRLVISKWIRPCEQATVEVQSVPAVPAVALPVVALLEEAASTDAEAETVYSTEARKADAATVTVTVSIQVEEAEEAKKPLRLRPGWVWKQNHSRLRRWEQSLSRVGRWEQRPAAGRAA